MPGAANTDSPIRSQLLAAAARLVAEHGVDALTTRKLASAVGTSTMAVYTHFGGMPSLMQALYREAFGLFGERLAGVPETDSPLVDVRRLSVAYRAFALEHPHFYEIMFGHSRLAFEPSVEDQAFAMATFDVLVSAIQRCVDAGLLAGPALAMGYQAWSALHGAVSLELVMPPGAMTPFSSGQVFDQLVDTIMAGLRAVSRNGRL